MPQEYVAFFQENKAAAASSNDLSDKENIPEPSVSEVSWSACQKSNIHTHSWCLPKQEYHNGY